MKSFKLIAIFTLFAMNLIACLWVFGIIGSEVASETMLKTFVVISMTGTTMAAVFVLTQNSGSQNESARSDRPGPKF